MKLRISLIIAVIAGIILTPVLIGNLAEGAPAKPPKVPVLGPDPYVSVYSDSAVYVSEAMPGANYNTYDKNYLRVGLDEFDYRYESLIRFGNIRHSDGGPLPEDAEITGASLRLYKDSSISASVNVYRLDGSFNENSVTWNTKPAMNAEILASKDLSASSGWYSINIPVSTVEGWADSAGLNYGIAVVPDWTGSKDISFRSDDFSSSRPVLVISYTGSEATPRLSPTPLPEDNTPCRVTYTVEPSNPDPGDLVTITVTATDNQALSYVSIMRGLTVLATENASAYGERELEVSYTETASLPGMGYTIIADDIGDAPGYRNDITVPVAGSGSGPEVDISIEWLDVESVVPERYRLIEGDGQTVRITATASDPDGIDMLTISLNGRYHDFTYSDETSVSETLTWVNNDTARSTFSYYASAKDKEALYSSTDAVYYDIAGLEDIRLMWSSAPGFSNYRTDRLSWTRMVQVFGKNECWWVESWGWKNPKALTLYHASFKSVAAGGSCFGFSTLCNELYKGRIAASEIEYPRSAYQMDRNNSYTKEYIEARQAAQLGREIIMGRINQYFESDDSDVQVGILANIERNLESDNPGVLSIREDGRGHAIVPWMTRNMSDGTSRVYVYDCNKVNGIHNASGDIANSSHYPYVEMSPSNWSYAFNSSDIWNDNLSYFTYGQAIGNASTLNRLGSASDAPYITDQTIPTLVDAIVAVFSGDADLYFEDEKGRITGIKDGKLREEIPGSMPVFPMTGGKFTDHEMYILPSGGKLTANVSGKGKDEYNLGLIDNSRTYSIEDKLITEGSKDKLDIEPDSDAEGHKLGFTSGAEDSDFTIRLAAELPGKVKKLKTDFIGREYILEKVNAGKGEKLSVHIEKGGDSIAAGSKTGGVSFDAKTRSTESADNADLDKGKMPESVLSGILLDKDETVSIAPHDWSSGKDGKLSVSDGDSVDYSTASSWAIPEIKQAIEYGLVTERILSNFKKNITREEFCEIVVKLYEKLSGNTAKPVSPNPFEDTANTEILKAYNLKIVKGVSATSFAPDKFITRQEICVMLYRALKAAKPSLDFSTGIMASFADEKEIAGWAINEVRYMNKHGIMKGVGGSRIDPLGNTTREQAIALVKRTYEAFR